MLENSNPEAGQTIGRLNDKCSNVLNTILRIWIAQFRGIIITQASMELYSRYLRSKDTNIASILLKGREYWSNELDKLQVKINEHIDSLLRLEDLK